jgi:hypothetical protein
MTDQDPQHCRSSLQRLLWILTYGYSLFIPPTTRVSFLTEGSTTLQLADTGVSCVEEVASSTLQDPDPLECEVRQAVLSIAEAGHPPPVTLLQIA